MMLNINQLYVIRLLANIIIHTKSTLYTLKVTVKQKQNLVQIETKFISLLTGQFNNDTPVQFW